MEKAVVEQETSISCHIGKAQLPLLSPSAPTLTLTPGMVPPTRPYSSAYILPYAHTDIRGLMSNLDALRPHLRDPTP